MLYSILNRQTCLISRAGGPGNNQSMLFRANLHRFDTSPITRLYIMNTALDEAHEEGAFLLNAPAKKDDLPISDIGCGIQWRVLWQPRLFFELLLLGMIACLLFRSQLPHTQVLRRSPVPQCMCYH